MWVSISNMATRKLEALQLDTSSPAYTSVTAWLGYQLNGGHALYFQGMMDLVFVNQQHFENICAI
jgi:hypothetical protein